MILFLHGNVTIVSVFEVQTSAYSGGTGTCSVTMLCPADLTVLTSSIRVFCIFLFRLFLIGSYCRYFLVSFQVVQTDFKSRVNPAAP